MVVSRTLSYVTSLEFFRALGELADRFSRPDRRGVMRRDWSRIASAMSTYMFELSPPLSPDVVRNRWRRAFGDMKVGLEPGH